MNLNNTNILIIGLGKTGISILKFLLIKYSCGISVYDKSYDAKIKNSINIDWHNIKILSGKLEEAVISAKFDFIFISPGISIKNPIFDYLKTKGVKILNDIELFLNLIDRSKTKVIAITGSNGKTTVTSLVGFLCRKLGFNVVEAGNIGIPVLDVFTSNENADVWVLELSSFQLESIYNLKADAAVCINVTQDHLERYDNLLEYAYYKSKIYCDAKYQIINEDDLLCKAMSKEKVNKIYFSIKDKNQDFYIIDNQGDINIYFNNQLLINLKDTKLFGIHNAINMVVALSLCMAIGIPIINLIAYLKEFDSLPHRMELVKEINGISFIDDSKGTNVGSTISAIKSFYSPIILILGGQTKGQNFDELALLIKDKVKNVLIIGKEIDVIKLSLDKINYSYVICNSLEEATKLSYSYAVRGDIVLLSPACASQDMFDDYKHRGMVFRTSIGNLLL